jgi:hypothetical protein
MMARWYNNSFLDEYYPGKWIGHGGPIPCPPRLPDLTPLNLSLCSFKKDADYMLRVPNFTEALKDVN